MTIGTLKAICATPMIDRRTGPKQMERILIDSMNLDNCQNGSEV
jgi:hypothetical protein